MRKGLAEAFGKVKVLGEVLRVLREDLEYLMGKVLGELVGEV